MNTTQTNSIQVSCDENGLIFVTCPTCRDAREERQGELEDEYREAMHAYHSKVRSRGDDFSDKNDPPMIADMYDSVPCVDCNSTGDLCAVIEVERNDTTEELEAKMSEFRSTRK